MKNVVLIGAGGHARSVIANLEKNHFSISGIYDSNFSNSELIFDIPVVSDPNDISAKEMIVLAIGDNGARKRLFEKFRQQIVNENIFHPSATLEKHVKCGVANLVFANCYLNNGVEIGDNNLINTSAVLEHEVVIGSHNHISVGAILLGRSKIGNNCFIGAGSVIRETISICDNVVVGAHSYVFADISEPGTYVGSPARKIK